MYIAIDIRKIGSKSTGSETYFHYLVQELAKLPESKKHDFSLLTDQKPAKIKKILGSLPENFKICLVAPTNKFLWTFYSLPRFFKKNPVDVFHTEYIVPFYLSKKIKIVTTIHDVSFKVNPEWITKKDALLLNSLIPLSIKRADAVIAVSNFSKNQIIKHYHCPEEKIWVTNPAVDARYFQVLSKKNTKCLDPRLRGDDNKSIPFILHISSLQPRKNVPIIIAAFAKLKKKWRESDSKWKNTKLVIVGQKNAHNYDQKIEEEVLKQVQYDSIRIEDLVFVGYQPARLLPYFYKEAVAFVFPSAYEGFGLPIIEAMASGTPVVASDIEVFREIADKAAEYVNIGKKDCRNKLAEKIKKLVEYPKKREEKIKLGLARAKTFSWKKLAEKTLEIYKNV